MFGYVRTDIPNMYVKDTVLYKAMYCGLCKGMGKTCGNTSRFTLNYDLTFLSIFLHNVKGVDVKIEKKHCIAHWITKRPTARPDELTYRVAALNMILAYYKLSDDLMDEGRGRIKRSLFKSAYKKAAKKEPTLDKIVNDNYVALNSYEKTGGDSIDISADFFGNMIKQSVAELLSDDFSEAVAALSYNLGKWIYLIDALDDYDKDKKRGCFNVFVNRYNAETKNLLIEKNRSEIEAIFGTIMYDIIEANKSVDYKFNRDLTDNILICGIRAQTKKVLEKTK